MPTLIKSIFPFSFCLIVATQVFFSGRWGGFLQVAHAEGVSKDAALLATADLIAFKSASGINSDSEEHLVNLGSVNNTKLIVTSSTGDADSSTADPDSTAKSSDPTYGNQDPEFRRHSVISQSQAIVLGIVEGITEYLPVSSTGHLVIASELLGVRNSRLTTEELDAVAAFEIIVQSGAILAVILLYWRKIKLILQGLLGFSAEGFKLFCNLMAAFLPTAILGLMFNKVIKNYLQHSGPVIFALVAGGIAMIVFERSKRAQKVRESGFGLKDLNIKAAIVIGLFQSVAMWPGTSRSMMTILGGMFMGLSPIASAEFSFLLGLPTLLAASGLKAIHDGATLIENVDFDVMLIGVFCAAFSAFLAVKAFVSWLNKHGLAPFGWYRIGVAILLFYILHVQATQ